MKALDIEIAVAKLFDIRQCFAIVPNVSWGLFSHELDVCIVRKSGYVIEVEIKVTKADLKADSKKRHGHCDYDNKIKELYFAVPKELEAFAKAHIPERAGLISVNKNNGSPSAWIVNPAQVKKGSRPLNAKEMMTIARLGTMRIWGLKNKLCKSEEHK